MVRWLDFSKFDLKLTVLLATLSLSVLFDSDGERTVTLYPTCLKKQWGAILFSWWLISLSVSIGCCWRTDREPITWERILMKRYLKLKTQGFRVAWIHERLQCERTGMVKLENWIEQNHRDQSIKTIFNFWCLHIKAKIMRNMAIDFTFEISCITVLLQDELKA